MVRSVLCLLTVALAFVPLLSAAKVPSEKPGVCPEPKKTIDLPKTSCLNECSSDSGCKDKLKCCFDGCGHVCKEPEKGGPKTKQGLCPRPGDVETCGSACRFDKDCKGDDKCCPTKCGRTCQPPVIKNKPGSCPKPMPSFAPCGDECTDDSQCEKNHKCCYGGCGRVCLAPEHVKKTG